MHITILQLLNVNGLLPNQNLLESIIISRPFSELLPSYKNIFQEQSALVGVKHKTYKTLTIQDINVRCNPSICIYINSRDTARFLLYSHFEQSFPKLIWIHFFCVPAKRRCWHVIWL